MSSLNSVDIEKLTTRDSEVLERLVQGESYKQISDHLGITERGCLSRSIPE